MRLRLGMGECRGSKRNGDKNGNRKNKRKKRYITADDGEIYRAADRNAERTIRQAAPYVRQELSLQTRNHPLVGR